jgi:aminoglycoside 3-N-acetyltransferase
MNEYTNADLIQVLRKIGLAKGDIVYLHSQFFSLGRMSGCRNGNELCEQIKEAFFSVITDEGTLVVPTFTTQTARYGTPFVLEETKCMTGMFSEYIRCCCEAVRSLHPINSVVALGKQSKQICNDVSASNYGIGSPFDRMLKMGAKSVNIGLERFSNSWFHYLEAVYCVPYLYNKLLDVEVYQNGARIKSPFFATVRYLDYGIKNNLNYFDSILKKTNLIRIESIGGGKISCISAETYCKVGLDLLMDDPYCFLDKKPAFHPGKIPFDGKTKNRDEKSDANSYVFLVDQ